VRLAALAEDHPNHGFLVVTWLGVAVSLAIVLAPVAYTVAVLYRPGPSLAQALLSPLSEALRTVSKARKAEREDFAIEDVSPPSAMAGPPTAAAGGTPAAPRDPAPGGHQD
jgi:hypothetical protein